MCTFFVSITWPYWKLSIVIRLIRNKQNFIFKYYASSTEDARHHCRYSVYTCKMSSFCLRSMLRRPTARHTFRYEWEKKIFFAHAFEHDNLLSSWVGNYPWMHVFRFTTFVPMLKDIHIFPIRLEYIRFVPAVHYEYFFFQLLRHS